MLDVNLVAARWHLGELSGEEMPGIACEALEQGHDGKNLRCLAGLTNPARRDAGEVVDGALQELGVQEPINKHNAALWMARRVASEIIEGRIEPYAGACRIWLSYSAEAPELQHWSNLATRYEVGAETGDIEKAKQEIVRAARNLLSGDDFGAAVERLRRFLRQNEYPENIVWVMPEDILLSGKRFVYVRIPIPATNEIKARSIYDEGVACGRGLLMTTICEMERSTCCFVWYPKSPEEEPQGLWPHDGSAKISVKMQTARVLGKPVKSRLLWALLKLRNGRNLHLSHNGTLDNCSAQILVCQQTGKVPWPNKLRR